MQNFDTFLSAADNRASHVDDDFADVGYGDLTQQKDGYNQAEQCVELDHCGEDDGLTADFTLLAAAEVLPCK